MLVPVEILVLIFGGLFSLFAYFFKRILDSVTRIEKLLIKHDMRIERCEEHVLDFKKKKVANI